MNPKYLIGGIGSILFSIFLLLFAILQFRFIAFNILLIFLGIGLILMSIGFLGHYQENQGVLSEICFIFTLIVGIITLSISLFIPSNKIMVNISLPLPAIGYYAYYMFNFLISSLFTLIGINLIIKKDSFIDLNLSKTVGILSMIFGIFHLILILNLLTTIRTFTNTIMFDPNFLFYLITSYSSTLLLGINGILIAIILIKESQKFIKRTREEIEEELPMFE